jgi:hypothetical protein
MPFNEVFFFLSGFAVGLVVGSLFIIVIRA